MSWFCVRTQARREQVAALNLKERVNLEVFAPRIRVQRSFRGLFSTVAEALFPGYIFARFAFPDQARHVASTTGVTGLVTFGGRPPVLADDLIRYLQTQVEATPSSVSPVFEEGTWVRIVSGCFNDAEGRVLHFDPKTERVRLLLTLLGREVQVSLSAQQLVSAREPRGLYPTGLLADEQATMRAAS
jgi:transcriptional antiterminator RfaH